MRKLAERTTQATTDIARMIDAIQDSSRAAVSAMRSAVEDVGGGVGMAEQAGSAIVQIKDGAERVVKTRRHWLSKVSPARALPSKSNRWSK
ncbi:MAG: hypothetical protein IPL11_02230 [Candidatus Accumulibacter sp.]|nr:hypothetical protein [Accumulibacter sp.]